MVSIRESWVEKLLFHYCALSWGKNVTCSESVSVLNENAFFIRFLRGLKKMKRIKSLNLIKPWLPHLQNEIITHLLQGLWWGLYEIMLTTCLTKSLTSKCWSGERGIVSPLLTWHGRGSIRSSLLGFSREGVGVGVCAWQDRAVSGRMGVEFRSDVCCPKDPFLSPCNPRVSASLLACCAVEYWPWSIPSRCIDLYPLPSSSSFWSGIWSQQLTQVLV